MPAEAATDSCLLPCRAASKAAASGRRIKQSSCSNDYNIIVSNLYPTWQETGKGVKTLLTDMHTSSVQMQCCSSLLCDKLCLQGNSSGPVVLSFTAEIGRLNWAMSRCHVYPSSLIQGMILKAGCRLHVWTGAQAMG